MVPIVGFYGSVILARSSVRLDDLNAIVDRDDDLITMVDYQLGWKLGEILGEVLERDAEAFLRDLTAETGRPAMTGYVWGSDCVDLKALAPRSGFWRACLVPVVAAGYAKDELGLEFEETFLPPELAVARAANWAWEAGLTPDLQGLEAVFALQEVDHDLVVCNADYFTLV